MLPSLLNLLLLQNLRQHRLSFPLSLQLYCSLVNSAILLLGGVRVKTNSHAIAYVEAE